MEGIRGIGEGGRHVAAAFGLVEVRVKHEVGAAAQPPGEPFAQAGERRLGRDRVAAVDEGDELPIGAVQTVGAGPALQMLEQRGEIHGWTAFTGQG